MLEMVAVAAAADIVVGNLVAVSGNLVAVAGNLLVVVGRVGFGMNRNPCLEREGDRKMRLDPR